MTPQCAAVPGDPSRPEKFDLNSIACALGTGLESVARRLWSGGSDPPNLSRLEPHWKIRPQRWAAPESRGETHESSYGDHQAVQAGGGARRPHRHRRSRPDRYRGEGVRPSE